MGVIVELQGLSSFLFSFRVQKPSQVHVQLLQQGLEKTKSCCWAKVRSRLRHIAAETRICHQHLAADFQGQRSLPKRHVILDVTSKESAQSERFCGATEHTVS